MAPRFMIWNTSVNSTQSLGLHHLLWERPKAVHQTQPVPGRPARTKGLWSAFQRVPDVPVKHPSRELLRLHISCPRCSGLHVRLLSDLAHS